MLGFINCLMFYYRANIVYCVFSKEVNARYETYVLSVGDFDERIFLGDDTTMEIGTPAKGSLAAAYESSERLQITRNLLQNYQDVSSAVCFGIVFVNHGRGTWIYKIDISLLSCIECMRCRQL